MSRAAIQSAPLAPALTSPRSPRGGFQATMHPTSSLRDPLPDATPPGSSRNLTPESDATGDDFQDQPRSARRRTRRTEGDLEAEHESPISHADKRRRVTSRSSRANAAAEGSGSAASVSSPAESVAQRSASPLHSPPRKGLGGLAPIKPIGFAAARESRREDGECTIPSPVVMGFDFQSVDGDQLKTVRDTISIKEQQQALIALRRRETAATTPATPKELTFKGWQPKDEKSGGVGKRREKTREKVEGLTIVTSATDRDVMPGSKSAPLNQGMGSMKSPREPVSGSQTAIPPHVLPPLPHSYHHVDPRTAPISHARTRHEDRDTRYEPDRGQYWRPLARPAYDNAPHTARPAISIPSSERRGYPGQSFAQSGRQYSASASPPHGGQREMFVQSDRSLYDLLHQAEQLRFSLGELLHRYENAYAAQLSSMNEFKTTASQANALLGSLQASANSLKEMVRYEVNRAQSTERREMDELKDRIRLLEEKLEVKEEQGSAKK